MKKLNNKGAVLIIAYIVLFALITLSAGVAVFNFNEMNYARRYYFTKTAFWLAEAGVNIFMKNTSMLDDEQTKTIEYGDGIITLIKDDSDPTRRVVTATGSYRGVEKSIQIAYPASAPEVFRNTVSVNGPVVINGQRVAVVVNDKARLKGGIVNTAKYSRVFFEDKRGGVDERLVSLMYPDADKNGTLDEFNDFVQFNRTLLMSYPREDVMYIKGDGTYTVAPGQSLGGKKILFFDGQEGRANVIVQSCGVVEEDQNLTIISTGTVTLNQMGKTPHNAQLNIIAWSGYKETAVLPGIHNGMVFTHGKAHFDNIYDTSVTNGNLVANKGITIGEVWSTKTFNYVDMRTGDIVPPGFEGLIGGGTTGYVSRPDNWKAL
ncbi:MAG: hypothetical protein KAJ18_07545 [Candidatus Omnitrophica bacterium]|nr:hypothetical protein [Candidatus Omnitrophota bacterium]